MHAIHVKCGLDILKRGLVVAVLLLSLSGCGALVTSAAWIANGKVPPPSRDDGHDPFKRELAARFAFMALLSEKIYYRKQHKSGVPCNARASAADLETSLFLGHSREQGRWVRAANTATTQFCLDHPNGLYFETFLFKTPNGKVTEAVIVFRGTEGLDLEDWGSNFAAFFGIEPPQYRTALEALEGVMQALSKDPKYDGAAVYTAGHSLGGGLAQQAAYRFEAVRAAYTFNTSPVTNWSWMVLRGDKPEQDWPVIYRVNHTGEFLSYPRGIATYMTATRYNRYDVGIQLKKRRAISGHAIAILGCGLTEVIVETEQDSNAHHYSLPMARFALNSDICAEFIKKTAKDAH